MLGLVRSFEVLQSGAGWVILDWKQLSDGGRVTAFRVRCRKFESGGWYDVVMSIDTKILLNDQNAVSNSSTKWLP